MTKTNTALSMLALLTLFTSHDSTGSLVLPDAEFAYSVGVTTPEAATRVIEEILVPLGFSLSRQPRLREDGFFRAEFQDAAAKDALSLSGKTVSLSGRVSCIRVGIYTSKGWKSPEAAQREAAEIYDLLISSLQQGKENALLFKANDGVRACDEAL